MSYAQGRLAGRALRFYGSPDSCRQAGRPVSELGALESMGLIQTRSDTARVQRRAQWLPADRQPTPMFEEISPSVIGYHLGP